MTNYEKANMIPSRSRCKTHFRTCYKTSVCMARVCRSSRGLVEIRVEFPDNVVVLLCKRSVIAQTKIQLRGE
ncbi:hypothetical protein NQ318_003675 [Aromia moschata]|uniref:Uncharacterized protein n=1 Tax=Aromia moschata TaxID=1265417 RepID=A0AAV8XKJ6_9CUCU|nr:hypothetical protein NQ318_003675 [Aromia moschata]